MTGALPGQVYVISARRPHRVPPMQALGVRTAWVVPEADVLDYRAVGALTVHGVPEQAGHSNLCAARNLALELAFAQGEVCVQTDDDLKSLRRRNGDGWAPADLADAVHTLTQVLNATDARLAGVPPTGNTYFARPGVQDHVFILGSLCAVAPSEPRFDETLPLKEDYDFTCRHLHAYGAVARTGDLVADYAHYSNPGGAVAFRTDAMEQATADRLLTRWPQYLRPHARRAHELSVRARRRT